MGRTLLSAAVEIGCFGQIARGWPDANLEADNRLRSENQSQNRRTGVVHPTQYKPRPVAFSATRTGFPVFLEKKETFWVN